MKTAVVILNWNGRKFLEKFLPPLAASMNEGSTIYIADNASTDGSTDLIEGLKKRFPEIRTMSFTENYGFTGGYNRALSTIEAEYYVLLNSDIEVSQGWLEPLENWMDTHPCCGICAPKLRSEANRELFEYAGAAGGYIDKFGYPFCRGRILRKTEKDVGQYDTPADVFWVSGACLMIRSELYRKLGGLDGRFFAHMEEIDLCWRTQLAGFKITVVPESIVYHVGGGSLPQGSPSKLYLNYRNNLLMMDNNLADTIGSAFRARTIIAFRMIFDGISAATYLLTFRFSYFSAVIRAHKDFRRLRNKVHPGKTRISPAHNETGISSKPSIVGIYGNWIIPPALILGTKAIRIAEQHIVKE